MVGLKKMKKPISLIFGDSVIKSLVSSEDKEKKLEKIKISVINKKLLENDENSDRKNLIRKNISSFNSSKISDIKKKEKFEIKIFNKFGQIKETEEDIIKKTTENNLQLSELIDETYSMRYTNNLNHEEKKDSIDEVKVDIQNTENAILESE